MPSGPEEQTGKLLIARCQSCGYQAWCPSFGGDPERAEAEAPHTREASLVGAAGA